MFEVEGSGEDDEIDAEQEGGDVWEQQQGQAGKELKGCLRLVSRSAAKIPTGIGA